MIFFKIGLKFTVKKMGIRNLQNVLFVLIFSSINQESFVQIFRRNSL